MRAKVMFNGEEYDSATAACRALGLNPANYFVYHRRYPQLSPNEILETMLGGGVRENDSIVATLAREDEDLEFGNLRFRNRQMAREYFAISPTRARSKLNLAQELRATPFIPINEMEEAEFEPLSEQELRAIERELRHLCGSVASQASESGGARYKLKTNHGREYQIEVRKTGLIYIQGQIITDAPTKRPMFGRYQKCGDNAWWYEGEFFIGREPRNAKLLKAALLALSREGI